MPTNLQPVFSTDIQAAVIALVQHDPLLQALFPPAAGSEAADSVPTILTSDTNKADGTNPYTLILAIPGTHHDTATLGPSGVGSTSLESYLLAICYASSPNWNPATDYSLGRLSESFLAAILRYKTDPNPVQRWFQLDLPKNPSTIYQRGSAFGRSVTYLRYQSRYTTP